jgi:hypothetical protein
VCFRARLIVGGLEISAIWRHRPEEAVSQKNNYDFLKLDYIYQTSSKRSCKKLLSASLHLSVVPHQGNDMIYIYLTANRLIPSGSSTAHMYTQTIHRIQRTERTQQ